MKRKKIIKWSLLLVLVGVLIGGSIFLYMWFMPHRNVQDTPVDFKITTTELVNEYINDSETANGKYLQEEGDSKILAVTGTVSDITTDMEGKKVVLLKEEGADLGVMCYFLKATSANTSSLTIGKKATIKGVIRSGAEYDEDLELYEDAVMQDCDVLISK